MKKFYIAYDTDVGIKKKTNQDSLLLKGCSEEHGETLLIAICDGMGGMEKGELASARSSGLFQTGLNRLHKERNACWG